MEIDQQWRGSIICYWTQEAGPWVCFLTLASLFTFPFRVCFCFIVFKIGIIKHILCSFVQLFGKTTIKLFIHIVFLFWKKITSFFKSCWSFNIVGKLNSRLVKLCYRARIDIFSKNPDSRYFRRGATWVPLLQCGSSHGQHVNEWTGLCAKQTLFMGIEIWIS